MPPSRPRTLRHATPWLGILTLLILGACAPKTIPEPDVTSLHPDRVWQLFLEKDHGGATESIQAFSCNASLHYAGQKTKSRVMLHFWGNLDYPLRLELQTGLGSTLALWREDAGEFLAYLPDKQTAYIHINGRLGMEAFGINLPFNLRELALLLNGRYADLLPERYTTVRKTKQGDYLYTVVGEQRRFSLVLGANGEIKAMGTLGTEPWSLEFSGSLDDSDLPGLPKKISMQGANGDKAILFIKKLEQRQSLWPADSLELDLPIDTKIMLLENS